MPADSHTVDLNNILFSKQPFPYSTQQYNIT